MKVYTDGVLDGTGVAGPTVSSTIQNTLGFAIGARADGANPVGGTMAWVTLLKEEVNATWVTGFHNGFIDMTGGNWLTMVPFVGDEPVWAEATSPFCVSS